MDSIKQNVPLAPLSSFKVGGKARFYLSPGSPEELIEGLCWAERENQKVFVFGRATNLVFSDGGFNGLVINIEKPLAHLKWKGNSAEAGAGTSLNTLVNQSAERGLAGIQNLAGIPGTLGGGAYINAGAFGQELGEVITKIRSCDRSGNTVWRSRRECAFGYRQTVFCQNREIILEIYLEFQPGDGPKLKREVKETLRRRKEKQPLEFANAGSMFKRPAGGYAGELIERAGLKGRGCGGAYISEKHANFIVNKGRAIAQDIYDLSEEVISIVDAKYGVRLEREVRMVGDFLPWPR